MVKLKCTIAVVLYLMSFGYTFSNKAYFYQAEHWVNNKNNLILLSDYHFASRRNRKHYQNQAHIQRQDLLNFLSHTNSIAIVEDLDALTLQMPGELESFIKQPLLFEPNRNLNISIECLLEHLRYIESPLLCLTQCCHALKIPVVNVDFRYFTVDFMQDLLHANDIFNLIIKEITEISMYQDSNDLDNFYQKKIGQFIRLLNICTPFYNDLAKTNLPTSKALYKVPYESSMDEIINQCCYKFYKLFLPKTVAAYYALEEFQTLTALDKKRIIIDNLCDELIDLKIIHQINEHKKHDYIIVLAGGSHILCIKKYLHLMGYKSKSSYGSIAQLSKTPPVLTHNPLLNLTQTSCCKN